MDTEKHVTSPMSIEEQSIEEQLDGNETRAEFSSSKKTSTRSICSYCFKEFLSNAHLMRHVRIHTGEKPFQCLHCDKTFGDKSSLKRHEKTLHADLMDYGLPKCEKLYVCSECSKEFSYVYHLKRHARTHTGEKPYECSHCKRIFSDISSLKRHEKNLHADEKKFSKATPVKRHQNPLAGQRQHELPHRKRLKVVLKPQRATLKRSHTKDKPRKKKTTKTSVCEICARSFFTKHLKWHMLSHTGEKLYVRSPTSFLHSARVNRHLRIHTGGEPHKCSPYVNLLSGARSPRRREKNKRHHKLPNNEKLRSHTISHGRTSRVGRSRSNHGTKAVVCEIHTDSCRRSRTGKKQHTCNHCLKIFSDVAHLSRHVRIHTGEKPYTCPHCGKKFSDISSMRRHEKSIHADEMHHELPKSMKLFVCSHCSKEFSRAANLKRHLITHTGEKPYMCSHCGKKLSDVSSLKKHEKSFHADEKDRELPIYEKPFICSHCSKKSSSAAHLKRHIRTHTGEKPFMCFHCGKKFADDSSLKRHEKNLHTVEVRSVSSFLPDNSGSQDRVSIVSMKQIIENISELK